MINYIILIIVLIADFVTVSIAGTACGPHCSKFHHDYNFVAWLSVHGPWRSMPYRYGESSSDLWGASVLRCLLVIALCILRTREKKSQPFNASAAAASSTAPMLQPLNADVTVAVASRSGDAEAGPADAPALGKARGLSASSAWWAAGLLVGFSWLHGISKGAARLLQSGPSPGAGLLPLDGSTPPEVEYWVCVVMAIVCSEAQREAFNAISASLAEPEQQEEEGPTGGSGGGGGGRKRKKKKKRAARGFWAGFAENDDDDGGVEAEKTEAEKAAEAAEEQKQLYMKKTTPESVRTLRFIMRMIAPDWVLLSWAYFSLILAALGESLVPMLYGQVIDAIAISPDMQKFSKQMLLLILTALGTGVFTGFRGSTFIVIGGRFGKRLRLKLFASLLQQELDFFGATKTGDVTSRLSADCQLVAEQVQLNVNVFLRSFIQVSLRFSSEFSDLP